MRAVSAAKSSLLKIDFAQVLLNSQGITAGRSVAFEEPGTLGIACVSYSRRVPSFKPADQAYHGIGYRISGAATLRTDKPRGFRHGIGHSGMTAVVPAQEASTWESVGAHEMIHFYLSAGFLDDLASSLYDRDLRHVQLQEAGFHQDASLARYALTFRDRLFQPDPPGELELNACAQLLGAHLLRCYSTLAGRPPPACRDSISPTGMRMLRDYIGSHLDAPLRLAELAQLVGMDQFRFAHAFQQTVGISPHQFVIQARLARAQELLRCSDQALSAIAAAVGFSSQSHMTSCFRRSLATTPGRFRRRDCRSAGI